MYSLFSRKIMMAGMITITLPFGTVTVATPASVQTSQPTDVNSGAGSSSSFNWSGYEATGGIFTGVSGTWIVPTVANGDITQADATWVGIGGVSTKDLIQVGTQAVINGSGAPTYQAWYEILPQTTTQVPVTVAPGDSMSASLSLTSAASGTVPAVWLVSIRDNTTGQSYQTSISYNSSLSSAEWIEEMPRSDTQAVALDNFGSVPFTNGMATKNGVVQTISGMNAQPLTMVNAADQTVASVSSIGADGESFTVTRTAIPVTVGIGSAGISGMSGLGRGWRRSGIGDYGGRWLRILQQFQRLRQQIQIRGAYLR